jgi:pyruvate/2-oxoglutarate dehydrogenase complex dihydrolipoamide dehydrogenase (E3) component
MMSGMPCAGKVDTGPKHKRGIAVHVATLPMSAVLRTRTAGETAGFMKVLVETAGDRILGAQRVDF